jgi:hypothetical protein
VAVVVGEAAVRIRPDVDGGEFSSEVEPEVAGALEEAGESGAARFTAAFGAALAIGGAFATSLENAALGDKLAAQLGSTPGESERLGTVAGDLYAGAYGDSLETVNEALRGVVQNVGGMADASSADLQAVTGSVLDLSTAMDQDVGAVSQSVGRLIQTGLASNAQEALDILTRGFQEGADRGGDLLDVVGEYGTTFSELGLSGGQSIGLLNQALAAGIPNADFAADALREMGIIAREGGEEAAEALGDLGLSADDYFAAMQEGGPAASAALDSVLDALRSTEDPALRSAAATALVGTQYEDLGDAILSLDPSAATDSLGQIEGAAGRMGQTLNDNASTNLTTFWRTAQTAFVDIVGGQVVPIVETVAALLATTLGPALDTVGAVVTGTIIPAVQGMAEWVAENETPIAIVAGLIATLFVPHLIALGVQAGIARGRVVASWIAQQASAIAAAVVHSAQIGLMIVRWVAMAAAAVLNAGITVASWVGMGIAAGVQAGIVAAAWLGAQLRTVASLGIMAAQTIASGAVMAASVAGTVARVVAGWVLMGVQSLLQAARMAAAWVIAMGPVGWVIAAVVGLVALIVANWTKVKEFTIGAFRAAVDFVVGAFRGLVSSVSGAIGSAVSFVTGLPGKIVRGIGNLGGLLVSKGRELIQGLVDGIAGAASFVGNVARNVVNSVIGFINRNVIDGINNLLEFTVAGITINPPDIPRIPTLHSGGVFDSGTSSGEGLALLRDDELVATPEQRAVADDLLRGLLAGRLPAGVAPAGVLGAPAPTVTNHIYASEGMSTRELGAIVSRDTVWSLGTGATRTVPIAGGAA